MAQSFKKISDLTLQELEDMVNGLENMSKISSNKSMNDLILKTIRETKRELEKRMKEKGMYIKLNTGYYSYRKDENTQLWGEP